MIVFTMAELAEYLSAYDCAVKIFYGEYGENLDACVLSKFKENISSIPIELYDFDEEVKLVVEGSLKILKESLESKLN